MTTPSQQPTAQHMFDAHKAAEFFVVGWCKEWTLGQYLRYVGALGDGDNFDDVVDKVTACYPWMPRLGRQYKNTIRSYVGSAYPKLSGWLFSRNTDIDRLKCAAQIEKLRPAGRLPMVRDSDRAEMKEAGRDEKQASMSYRLSREAFKSHQRSAWNVCK